MTGSAVPSHDAFFDAFTPPFYRTDVRTITSIYGLIYTRRPHAGQTPTRRSPAALDAQGVPHPADAGRWLASWLQHHAGSRGPHRRPCPPLAGSDVRSASRTRRPRVDRGVREAAQ